MMTVRLLPEAEAEVDEAMQWCDRQEYGVGARFVAAVGEGFGKIAEHPERYPECATLRDGSVLRRMLLTRFPYAIVYHVESAAVVVVAVAHGARRPGYWRGRI